MKHNSIKYLIRRLRYFYHYNIGSLKLPYAPLTVSIEPTNDCTINCIMCPRSIEGTKVDRGYMELDLYKKIIKQIASTTEHLILDIGGEPTLHPHLVEMIKIAKAHDIYVTFDTNATILNSDLSKRILDSGLDRITFSFDAQSKEMYEKMRKGAVVFRSLEL